MTGLEILFITNALVLLVFWGWFIFLGFNTSRGWGLGLTFLFPFSPFLFAYRFERKTRKIIYYFVISLVIFIALNGWIYFATSVDFFPNFGHKLSKLAPTFNFSEKPKPKLNLPKPTPIPDALPVEEKPPVEQVKKVEAAPVQKHGYKTVDIESAHSYIGKKVIVSTAVVVHRGVLKSVGMSQIEIKKDFGGGSTVMGVSKSKIQKLEVYL